MVCQPKGQGGIGIKDVNMFNIALLARWRWDIFQLMGALWYIILESKYGG